jgi:hypothetical protein
MTSTKKIAASRSNAAKSTGPKTAQGKKRARTNALRHGLAANAPRDPATSAEIERLARWFCGDGATPEQYEHAHAIAEEHLILQRVETAYVAIIERAMNTAHDGADQGEVKLGVTAGREIPPCAPAPATPSELDALSVALPPLVKLDRYMQRALARHRRAIRAFVAASVLHRSDAGNRVETLPKKGAQVDCMSPSFN